MFKHPVHEEHDNRYDDGSGQHNDCAVSKFPTRGPSGFMRELLV